MNAGNKNFRNRKPQRASWWDYSNSGTYFITINCKDRCHYFGNIKNQEMHHSKQGIIALLCMEKLHLHYCHIEIGCFVIMPDHVHAIIIIHNQKDELVSNENKATLSSIVGNFKSAVSRYCNRLNLEFAWQRSFHDSIIKNTEAYCAVERYIQNNPLKWNS